MRFNRIFLTWCAIVLILEEGITFDIPTEDFGKIPGCITFKTDSFPGVLVECEEFDINITAALLPNSTAKLKIFGVNGLPTNVSLVPQLTMLVALELPLNNINTINSIMFKGLSNLKNISLHGNCIEFVSVDAFSNNLNLEAVDLSDNCLLSLKHIIPALATLKNLKYVNLSHNKNLTLISDEDFVPLENSTIETLEISSCAIANIEENAFKPLKILQHLDISINPLSEEGLNNLSFNLQNSVVKNLNVAEMKNIVYFPCSFIDDLIYTRIESLNISKNKFYCYSFGSSPYIKSLVIIGSELPQLTQTPFTNLPNLEVLIINGHQMQGIDKHFKSNIHLKFLDLSFLTEFNTDSIFIISDFAFENLNELNTLNLQYLPIRMIRRYTLYGLNNVRKITFKKDRLFEIDCYAFETLDNVVDLDLSYNAITQISECTFFGLKSIKFIDISHNLLTFISGTRTFEHTPNLFHLNLNFNTIVSLPNGLFKNLTNLEVVLMNNNSLGPWNNDFLPDSSNFVVLNVGENSITHLTKQMFKDFSKLEIIDFSNNPFNCSDCSIVKLKEWLRNTTVNVFRLRTYGAYMCHYPHRYRYLTVLEADVTSHISHCVPEDVD